MERPLKYQDKGWGQYVMIRKEITGIRSLAFSQWIRENLPDTSTGYVVQNLDWIFHNYKSRILMMIEEKTYGGQLRYAQTALFNDIIAPALGLWCEENDYEWRGFHFIRFENTCPEDGNIYWDEECISENTLIKRLSF